MINKIRFLLITMMVGLSLTACNNTIPVRSVDNGADTLRVYSDGKMMFRDRVIPVKDVFIYPDGFGGEKAAVKLYVPYHPPFYRDSIVVERLNSKS